ncbi:MAG: molybdopterin molybdotransferase MoeA, partial [Betaproteobacteria bacterium]|nr:molybdopterin molybdotransferase MoeA [Betaproteobacteria bacterium]
RIRLNQAAGRVLAENIHAPTALPRTALATMDGFAAARADLGGQLPIVGSAMAGQPYTDKLASGQTVRIATGAVVPEGADCVIPIEQAQEQQGRVGLATDTADNIRQPGEELAAGAVAVAAGTALGSRQLGLLAALGIDRVPVYPRLRIGLLATGDELRSPGQTLVPGSIYESNRLLLAALLCELGFAALDLGIAADDRHDLEAALERAHAQCDVIVTSGGASVGSRDLIRQMLIERGSIRMWKVAMKPGRPFIAGNYRGRPVYGLPGNPVSAYACLLLLVVPALWKGSGHDPIPTWPRLSAQAGQTIIKKPGRADYQRGLASTNPDGSWQVVAVADQSSASLTGLVAANCLIELAPESDGVEAGAPVAIIPLPGTFPYFLAKASSSALS